MAQRQPSSTGGMGDAVWGSADAERFSLGRVDPTLRRLRAPLSGATKQERPQGGFWRYAPGRRRGCGLLGTGIDAGSAAPGKQPYKGLSPRSAQKIGCAPALQTRERNLA